MKYKNKKERETKWYKGDLRCINDERKRRTRVLEKRLNLLLQLKQANRIYLKDD